jgi:hypothetical protein
MNRLEEGECKFHASLDKNIGMEDERQNKLPVKFSRE